jgi:predicted anti-sigma-YlaC factor YlaD
MGASHWTEDDLLNRLYGLPNAGEDHLAACPECRARLEELRVRRQAMTQPPDVPHDFLAAQRRAIYSRLEHSRNPLLKWGPAFAATVVLATGFLAYRHEPTPVKSDEAVIAEIYSMEQSAEPAVAQPIQALFESN